jgi:hypothetical protein
VYTIGADRANASFAESFFIIPVHPGSDRALVR